MFEDVIIAYCDAQGNVTVRYISSIRPNGSDSIYAFCHLRHELRTFKIARILYAVDPDTGELIENHWSLLALTAAEGAAMAEAGRLGHCLNQARLFVADCSRSTGINQR